MKKLIFICFLFLYNFSYSQKLEKLTVEKIMRDQKWIGTSPRNPSWSADGRFLFFLWNPEKAISDSLYYISATDLTPKKTTFAFRQNNPTTDNGEYNTARTAFVYSRDGDLFYYDLKSNSSKRITQTIDVESNPRFVENDSKIVFSRNQNLFFWNVATGATVQVTNFKTGTAPKDPALTAQEKWLQQNQLETSEVLRKAKEKREKTEAANKAQRPKELRSIYLADKNLFNLTLSPDGRFVTYNLVKPATGARTTIVPSYVTESGYTTELQAGTKVGAPQSAQEFYVFDTVKDTVLLVKTDKLPGITDPTDFIKAGKKDTAKNKTREVRYIGPFWNEKGTNAVVEIRSLDNKDRWLMLLDAATASLKLLDRQRDEAWIGGPRIGFGSFSRNSWIDDQTFWFHSEATGYSHLYKINVSTGVKTAITSGNYEVQQSQLSNDKKTFYITTNEVHAGEKQFYWLPVNGGKLQKLTNLPGANQVTISPDEKNLAILYSYSNKPWELYFQPNVPTAARATQITSLAQSDEFKSYPWREPEVITFTASDGAKVPARLYRPANPHPSKPAVIFVHGAGYLQNAHKWWSDYSREYMFNNLLADNGYTVLDIDYRGSAGYGRDWRTGIYRFMGGKDLSDHVDGAKYLVQNLGVDPKRIGIYGGSYGGFITLMAMFQHADVFAAGAALRSVTDWAHYNHGYTSNILNEPFTDSIAFKKSSPIYYAEGLKGHLLMCHGMVDVNVHFQDIVRLTQRLIELGKDNWELAVYPVEDHAFTEPSSWTDEYKRVFKLFETVLKK